MFGFKKKVDPLSKFDASIDEMTRTIRENGEINKRLADAIAYMDSMVERGVERGVRRGSRNNALSMKRKEVRR